MKAVYIESKIDGIVYCKTNGQFTRYLTGINLSYKEYYETYVSGVSPLCSCLKPRTFVQKSESYLKTCSNPKCMGKCTSDTIKQWTDDQKESNSNNKSRAQSKLSVEQKSNARIKAKITSIERYGEDWKSIQQEKVYSTKLERYGSEHYANSKKASETRINKTSDEKDEINNKRRATNLERYGVENPLCLASPSKINKGNQSLKDFVLPSGRTIGIRGHEPTIIAKLLTQYDETELSIHDAYSPITVPVFTYTNAHRNISKYYPDIYIKKDNLIIEVKSRWWWDGYGSEKYKGRLYNNMKKREVALNEGYEYHLYIFDRNNNYKIFITDDELRNINETI
jgi:hypothetical protein